MKKRERGMERERGKNLVIRAKPKRLGILASQPQITSRLL
jgi:hypothetical protein